MLMFAILGAATTIGAARQAVVSSNYRVAHVFVLGETGGWDYLNYDAADKHLFVSRATRVMVVDPASGTAVGEIPDTPGVHGIAIAGDLGKGFTSNGRANSLTVFDLHTLKTTNVIHIDGRNPDAIVYDAFSKRIFTFNGGSNDATVIDAAAESVVGTIALPGRPEFAATNGTGMLYVNIEDKSELVAIDVKTDAVTATWPLAPCEEPSGLSIDAAHHRLFAGCANQLMAVVDSDNGRVVTTLPIGKGVDATAFDAVTARAFSSNGDGTLTVVHEDSPSSFSVVQTVTTQQYARTLALDTATHAAYLVTAKVLLGPPASGEQRSTRTIVPGSFTLLVVDESKP